MNRAFLVDARYESSGRCTVVEIFPAESMNQGFLFDTDPVEKCHTYWDGDYQDAQIVREAEPKTEERKQTPRICGVANKAIDPLFDHPVVLPYRHIHGELMLQGNNSEPANKQSADDESDTSNGKKPGSKLKVSGTLKADKHAQGDGYENSDQECTHRRFVELRIRRLRALHACQGNFRP